MNPLKVVCPWCRAGVDEVCTTSADKPARKPHTWRYNQVHYQQTRAAQLEMSKHQQNFAAGVDPAAEARSALGTRLSLAKQSMLTAIMHVGDLEELLLTDTKLEEWEQALSYAENEVFYAHPGLAEIRDGLRESYNRLDQMWNALPEYRPTKEE